jgi:hypothetical protein
MRGFLIGAIALLHHPLDSVGKMHEAFCLLSVNLHSGKLESFDDELESSNEEDGHK